MAHLTGNFTSEAPLSPAVREAVSAAFEQGWADPKKRSQASHRAGILADQAKSEIAAALGARPSQLEIVGESSLVHYLAIEGFLTPETHLVTTAVDLGKIRAVARAFKGSSQVLEVSRDGLVFDGEISFAERALLSLQACNGETGVNQDLERFRGSLAKIIVDATRAIPSKNLVEGFSATTFDSTSWNGPAGLAFIAINDDKSYAYPLPHIAPIRVPGSFSLPLLIGSAVAIHEFIESNLNFASLREYLAKGLDSIQGVEVIASSSMNSRYLSAHVEAFSSEEILNHLQKLNISIDAGSACSPEDLTPSHVIAAMGYKTNGHIRFTLHPHHKAADIDYLINSLSEVLTSLHS